MRINISLTKSTEIVPFNYQNKLTGVFHKWLKSNEVHDKMSLYSISWLKNGEEAVGGLKFNSGSSFFVSSYDSILLKTLVKGIQSDPTTFSGMLVTEIGIQETPFFENEHLFHVASPVFIKQKLDNKFKFYYYYDNESSTLMTNTLKRKLRSVGLDDNNVSVEFDKRYRNPRIKGTLYNNIYNKGSICPVIVKGSSEQIAFAWNVGIGNCTGIGFGSLI